MILHPYFFTATLLTDPGASILLAKNVTFNYTNLLTFDGRYSTTTYVGPQFSQLGTTFVASLNVKF
ncbi:hypothetical protein [Pedobacter sp. L105]|uniref:hypothetical protein n=1 Tax=Pedobacter sp. L105 TaxID=1641871 RepID=UPI00131E7737|nr:hypothetical protein [Pedobacter sp. L105]